MSPRTATRRSGSLAAAFLAVLVAACTAAPGESDPGHQPTQSPDPGGTGSAATSVPSPRPAPSSTGVPSASLAVDGHDAIDAARGLLETRAANVEMDVRREKRPADPVETLIVFEGRVEPALGRGHMRLDFSGLVAVPGATASPGPDSIVDLIWTPDELYARYATRSTEGWESRSRTDARVGSGYLGRAPDEVLGLLKLVATSRPETLTPLAGAQLDGELARRWLVRVPVEATALEGVPADVPDATVLRDVYGIDALDIEVWLVDGALRRVRYAIAREKALYGGPDRTTVTYDWSVTPGADPIVAPPPP